MKKIISVILFILSLVIYFWITNYTKSAFDYNWAQFVGYLFYWNATLFIASLFMLPLSKEKYKKYLIFTTIYVIISILFAYQAGQGSTSIISFDGKLITLLLIGLYFLITIIYFIVQFVKNRKTK